MGTVETTASSRACLSAGKWKHGVHLSSRRPSSVLPQAENTARDRRSGHQRGGCRKRLYPRGLHVSPGCRAGGTGQKRAWSWVQAPVPPPRKGKTKPERKNKKPLSPALWESVQECFHYPSLLILSISLYPHCTDWYSNWKVLDADQHSPSPVFPKLSLTPEPAKAAGSHIGLSRGVLDVLLQTFLQLLCRDSANTPVRRDLLAQSNMPPSEIQ